VHANERWNTAAWADDWLAMARRYAGNPRVVGADLGQAGLGLPPGARGRSLRHRCAFKAVCPDGQRLAGLGRGLCATAGLGWSAGTAAVLVGDQSHVTTDWASGWT